MLPVVSQEPMRYGRAALSDTIPSELFSVDFDSTSPWHDEHRNALHQLLEEVVSKQVRMTYQLENWIPELSRKLDSLLEMQLHAGLWNDKRPNPQPMATDGKLSAGSADTFCAISRPSDRGVRFKDVDNRTTAIATKVEEVFIHMNSSVEQSPENSVQEVQRNGKDADGRPTHHEKSIKKVSKITNSSDTGSAEAYSLGLSGQLAPTEYKSGIDSSGSNSAAGPPVFPHTSAQSKMSIAFLCSYQRACHQVVASTYFEMFFATLILSNSVFLGIQVQWLADNWDNSSNYPAYHDAIAYIFFAAFLVELLLRIFADGCRFFYAGSCCWNWFDFIIVTLSVVERMLTQVYDQNGRGFGVTRIIRVTRVVRNLRVMRLVKSFRQMGKLVTAIEHTMKECVWALLLFIMILYIFSILFTQAVADRAERLGAHSPTELSTFYGSLSVTMFTLFKSITGGIDWHDAVVPLAHVGAFHVVLFVMFLCFMYFVLLNVITGMFCQSAFESVMMTEEEEIEIQMAQKDDYVRKLKVLFGEIDIYDASYVTYEQFDERLNDPRVGAFFKSLGIDTNDALGVFELLDVSGEGQLDIHEFIHGCLEIQGAAKNIHIHRMIFENRYMRIQIDKMLKLMVKQFPDAGESSVSLAPSVQSVRTATAKTSGKMLTGGMLPKQRRSFFRTVRASQTSWR